MKERAAESRAHPAGALLHGRCRARTRDPLACKAGALPAELTAPCTAFPPRAGERTRLPWLHGHTETLPFADSFRDLSAAVLCAVTVGLIARSIGGWWPTTWSWAAFALLFVAAAALILQPAVLLGRLDLAFLGGLGAFAVWTGLSWFWSESPPKTMLELERTVLYLGGVLALLLVARRRSFAAALGGLLAVDVALCGHALATRLVPDHVELADLVARFPAGRRVRLPERARDHRCARASDRGSDSSPTRTVSRFGQPLRRRRFRSRSPSTSRTAAAPGSPLRSDSRLRSRSPLPGCAS